MRRRDEIDDDLPGLTTVAAMAHPGLAYHPCFILLSTEPSSREFAYGQLLKLSQQSLRSFPPRHPHITAAQPYADECNPQTGPGELGQGIFPTSHPSWPAYPVMQAA